MKEQVYTIVAGINGAGKSTLYKDMNEKEKSELGKRINPDEIAEKLGDFNDSKIQIMAGKEAINMRKECIKNKENFHIETTLSNSLPKILKEISEAKKNGFEIRLYYVGVKNKETAFSRVNDRVEKGGHYISEEDINRRYGKSLDNLAFVMKEADKVKIFDNSGIKHKKILEIINNKEKFKKDITNWLKEPLKQYKKLIKEDIKIEQLDLKEKSMLLREYTNQIEKRYVYEVGSKIYGSREKDLKIFNPGENCKEFSSLEEVVKTLKNAGYSLEKEKIINEKLNDLKNKKRDDRER